MSTDKITEPAAIRGESKLAPGALRYWRALAQRENLRVQVVDPFREPLKTLREEYPKGTVVYRASTGGRWGKSSSIVTL